MSDLIKRAFLAARKKLQSGEHAVPTENCSTGPTMKIEDVNQSAAISSIVELSPRVGETMSSSSVDANKSLFANVSMELRTPLTLILSPLESLVMGEYGSLNPEQTALLKTIHTQSVKLLQIVSGMLDHSNMQSGVEVSRQSVDVGVLTGAVVSELNASKT